MYLCPNTCKSQTTHGDEFLSKPQRSALCIPGLLLLRWWEGRLGEMPAFWICKSPSEQWHRKLHPSLDWNQSLNCFRCGILGRVWHKGGFQTSCFLPPILQCFLSKGHWYNGKTSRTKLRNPRTDYKDNWLKCVWFQCSVSRVRDWGTHCQWGDQGPCFHRKIAVNRWTLAYKEMGVALKHNLNFESFIS